MGTIIEKKICSVQISKTELINTLLNSVNPGVTANDITSVSMSGESGFFRVWLQPSVVSGVTTQRMFDLTCSDLASQILVNYDPAITGADVLSIAINGTDASKIDVSLKEKQVTMYG